MKLLLRPRWTLATAVTGLAAMAGMALTTIGALAPIETRAELVMLRPWIIAIDTLLGAIAGACIVLAAVGRSILWWVDHETPVAVVAVAIHDEPPAPPTAESMARLTH